MIPDNVCLICKKEVEDGACTVKGYWKGDEPRFNIDACITCFDRIRLDMETREALNKLEDFHEYISYTDFDKLLDNSTVRQAILDHVLPVWSRNKYRDAEQQ